MPVTRHASGRKHAPWRQSKSVRNEPLPFRRAVPPVAHEELSADELAEIERMLEMMASAESVMGCDYPEGPMSPSGCLW